MTPRRGFAMVNEDDPHWVRFWELYPKRQGKKDARAAWAEVAPTATDVALMEVALVWQTRQPSWIKDGGQYIPLPSTWLRAERWTDEPPLMAQPRPEWNCPHLDACSHRQMCATKHVLGTTKYPLKSEQKESA